MVNEVTKGSESCAVEICLLPTPVSQVYQHLKDSNRNCLLARTIKATVKKKFLEKRLSIDRILLLPIVILLTVHHVAFHAEISM